MQVRVTEAGLSELRKTQSSIVELSAGEISPTEIWVDVTMLFPPLVPNLSSPFENLKMFLICHGDPPFPRSLDVCDGQFSAAVSLPPVFVAYPATRIEAWPSAAGSQHRLARR